MWNRIYFSNRGTVPPFNLSLSSVNCSKVGNFRIQGEGVELKEENSKEVLVEDDEVSRNHLFVGEANPSNLASAGPPALQISFSSATVLLGLGLFIDQFLFFSN